MGRAGLHVTYGWCSPTALPATTPPPRLQVNKDCLLALVDVTAKQAEDAQERSDLDTLKGTLSKC